MIAMFDFFDFFVLLNTSRIGGRQPLFRKPLEPATAHQLLRFLRVLCSDNYWMAVFDFSRDLAILVLIPVRSLWPIDVTYVF
jgi:hypothetical protein